MKLLAALSTIYMASVVAASTVKIMPFGASIVGAPGCWRAILWRKLQSAGITNTNFVGSNPAPDCGFPYDGDNEGHAGALAIEYVEKGNLTGWLAKAKPDVIIQHLGTNDVVQGKKTADIISAYSTLVDEMRESKADIQIIFSNLIPVAPSKFGAQVPTGIIDLNKAIANWVPTKTTQKSPITLVDMWTGFNTTTDTVDGEHPNNAGNQKFADKFYPVTVNAIHAVSPV